MHLKAGLILLAIVLLFACRSTDPLDELPKQLVLKTSTFEDVTRWGDLTKLYAFGKGDAGWKVQPELSNVRVTGYEAGRLTQIEPWRWGQTAVISYVLKDRQVLRKVVDHQFWVSEDEGESWYRENPPPQF